MKTAQPNHSPSAAAILGRPAAIVGRQVRITTDNWLIETSADLLEQRIGFDEPAGWLLSTEDGLKREITTRGAVQVVSLLSLLEFIVLAEDIQVMEGYSAWRARDSMRALSDRGLVVEQDRSEVEEARENILRLVEQRSERKEYLATPEVEKPDEAGIEDGLQARRSFYNQVVPASASYLAIAQDAGAHYAPHPVRARFLRSRLYPRTWPTRSVNVLNNIVQTGVCILDEATGANRWTNRLAHAKVPGLGVLCLQESSNMTNPIDVALGLRDEKEFGQLRVALSRMNDLASVDGGDPSAFLASANEIKKAMDFACRSVGLELPNATPGDGLQVGLALGPVSIGGALPRRERAPRFSTVMRRFLTFRPSLEDVLRAKLGITHASVFADLANTTLW